MKLAELIQNTKLTTNLPNLEISGIESDSRKVQKGYLFAALKGVTFNGEEFIAQAIQNGAVAILCESSEIIQKFPHTAILVSGNAHRDFALLAAAFYGKQPENIAAVTGTNGKTSIADFTRQVLIMMGQKAASLGTLGLIKNNEEPQYAMTTPDTLTIHKTLRSLADDNFKYLIMETSSHGLCQYRVGGVKFKVAGFTNLTRDHLDYHKTMENYYKAKELLFTEFLEPNGAAVLNADIDIFNRLKNACISTGKRVISYGRNGEQLKLLHATPLAHGQMLDVLYYGKNVSLNIPLAGEFQAMNVLCALGILAELTKQPFEVVKYIEKIHGAKGRLELVAQTPNGAAIYVDYAHTPDAIENVIKALRPHCSGKLRILFGCGGDRDKGKRPLMGKIANDLADVVYITDDNPRSEEPEVIRAEILAACPKGIDIGNRGEAIKQAISELESGDILIVAGKGHEPGQIIKGVTHHFSDHEEVLKNV